MSVGCEGGDSRMKGRLMYTLDTDIAIWVLRNDTEIVAAVKRVASQYGTSISTITIAELYKNIFPTEITATEDFVTHQMVVPVSEQIAREAGYYWQQFRKQIATLSLTDCIVAATAKVNHSRLMTLNVRHFPMTDISVYNPRRPL